MRKYTILTVLGLLLISCSEREVREVSKSDLLQGVIKSEYRIIEKTAYLSNVNTVLYDSLGNSKDSLRVKKLQDISISIKNEILEVRKELLAIYLFNDIMKEGANITVTDLNEPGEKKVLSYPLEEVPLNLIPEDLCQLYVSNYFLEIKGDGIINKAELISKRLGFYKKNVYKLFYQESIRIDDILNLNTLYIQEEAIHITWEYYNFKDLSLANGVNLLDDLVLSIELIENSMLTQL